MDEDTGGPVEGAVVDWTLNFPDLTASGTALTDADGVADFSYRVNARKTDTGGSWVDVTVTADGYDTATNSADFTVD